MKTTIKRGLLAMAFTAALGAVTISQHGQEWRHVLHYAPDFLAGFAGMAVIVAAFVGAFTLAYGLVLAYAVPRYLVRRAAR